MAVGPAPINADGASVRQSVYLRSVRADGTVSLNLAQVGGTLTCEEATFLGADGVAIWADGIKVGGDVLLRADPQLSGASTPPFRASGAVRLVGAERHGDLDCSGGEFLNPKGDAIVLERATIHGEIFLGTGFKADGVVSLSNTSALRLRMTEPVGLN